MQLLAQPFGVEKSSSAHHHIPLLFELPLHDHTQQHPKDWLSELNKPKAIWHFSITSTFQNWRYQVKTKYSKNTTFAEQERPGTRNRLPVLLGHTTPFSGLEAKIRKHQKLHLSLLEKRVSRHALSIRSRQCFLTAGICFFLLWLHLPLGRNVDGEIILVIKSYKCGLWSILLPVQNRKASVQCFLLDSREKNYDS